jgi:AraC family transcriptional regulator
VTTAVQDSHFYGAVRALRAVGPLTLAETAYRPGAHVPAHAHENAICCLVLRGALTERRGRRPVLCEPGTLLFHPWDEPHAHDFHAVGAGMFTVVLGTPWRDRLREIGGLAAPKAVHRSRASWIAHQLYGELRSDDTASALVAEGLSLAMLAEIARHDTPAKHHPARPHWLEQSEELLRAHFLDALGMAEVAAAVGVHPVHLARSFRRHYGCTMGEYVRRLRIDFAARALTASDAPLAALAQTAGFADQGHFTRAFKAATGLTPGAYRRATRP